MDSCPSLPFLFQLRNRVFYWHCFLGTCLLVRYPIVWNRRPLKQPLFTPRSLARQTTTLQDAWIRSVVPINVFGEHFSPSPAFSCVSHRAVQALRAVACERRLVLRYEVHVCMHACTQHAHKHEHARTRTRTHARMHAFMFGEMCDVQLFCIFFGRPSVHMK